MVGKKHCRLANGGEAYRFEFLSFSTPLHFALLNALSRLRLLFARAGRVRPRPDRPTFFLIYLVPPFLTSITLSLLFPLAPSHPYECRERWVFSFFPRVPFCAFLSPPSPPSHSGSKFTADARPFCASCWLLLGCISACRCLSVSSLLGARSPAYTRRVPLLPPAFPRLFLFIFPLSTLPRLPVSL